MGRLKNFFLVSSTVVFLIPQFGCAFQKRCLYLEAPAGQVYFNPGSTLEDSVFLSKWLGPVNERDKIDYLLDRVAASDYNFMRNGESHNGRKARLWLLYKMHHWVDGVQTADDFVTRVAAFSQKTRAPYLVEFPDGKIYSLKSVLQNELSRFENRLAYLRQVSQAGAVQPGPVSLSAAAAVAATTSKK